MDDRLQLLKGFLAADKPEWAEPVDVLLIAHLLARADDEMKSTPSWETLANCSRVHHTTIYRAVTRMEKHGWIVKHSGARRQLGNTYVVQVDNLPMKNFTATVVSDDAKRLAGWYLGKVRMQTQWSRRYKKNIAVFVRKGSEQRWAFVMQSWLDAGYCAERIKAGVELAFHVDAKRAVRGPQTMRLQWKQIMATVEKQMGDSNG
jgi:predicted transcriptional regulator